MNFNAFDSIEKFTILDSEILLKRATSPRTYCESVGPKAAILGTEAGIFECWIYPLKIASHIRFDVSLPEYRLFVKGTEISKSIQLRPEMTTLIFSHELFTINWHLFTPLKEPGGVFLFDIDTYCPLELWISFVPELVPMWPAGLGGQYTRWLDELNGYLIAEGSKKFAGIIGSPLATDRSNTPGHQLPHEPMKFVISVSKKMAEQNYIPIIITGSMAGKEEAVQSFRQILQSIPQLYQHSADHYRRLGSALLTIKTPEPKLDLAFEWAKISLDKGRVENPQLGNGMVAGYGNSGKTQRPGFAWFFGGDSCLNSLAINGYGDFEVTRQALTMLRDNQRRDGKIFHELTQSAAMLKWFEAYPYGFYHAETTPFFIVAMHDYFIRSGDETFLRESWHSIKRAYRYCLTADEDGDGLMENSAAGLAAMEVGEMLQQNRVDIYLATIWLKALQCMIRLADFFDETSFREQCQQQFETAHRSLLCIFVDDAARQLNFALLTDGNKHRDPTVWQSLPLFFELIELQQAENTMRQFNSAAMSTDWGIRGIAQTSQYYDPISYNNGSVWAFTTGYVATAQFKHHQAINGFHNLMANARLTWLDALGWHTELLSGEYYRPVSTSVPHQLFSATGIINPVIRGLLGLESDAITRRIKFAPHLPMDWDRLQIHNYRCGQDSFSFALTRSDGKISLQVTAAADLPYQFTFSPALSPGAIIEVVRIDAKENEFSRLATQHDVHCEVTTPIAGSVTIEIDFQPGIEFEIPVPEPAPGDHSRGLKLIDYRLLENRLILEVEGRIGEEYFIRLKSSYPVKGVSGGNVSGRFGNVYRIKIVFHDEVDPGYQRKTVVVYLD